jgi:hypothetical protein
MEDDTRKNKRRWFRGLKIISTGLLIFVLISVGGFLYSKFVAARTADWQVEVTVVGGVAGRWDKYLLVSDGRLIHQNGVNSTGIRIPAETVAGIYERIAECDLPRSFSIPLPEIGSGPDRVGRTVSVILDGRRYGMPDLFLNPLREIASIRLQQAIDPLLIEATIPVGEGEPNG